jgi:hypothetical protein
VNRHKNRCEHDSRPADDAVASSEACVDEARGDAPAAVHHNVPAGRMKPALPPRSAREIGGREGPDPTRYGDWEKGGRCIDF